MREVAADASCALIPRASNEAILTDPRKTYGHCPRPELALAKQGCGIVCHCYSPSCSRWYFPVRCGRRENPWVRKSWRCLPEASIYRESNDRSAEFRSASQVLAIARQGRRGRRRLCKSGTLACRWGVGAARWPMALASGVFKSYFVRQRVVHLVWKAVLADAFPGWEKCADESSSAIF